MSSFSKVFSPLSEEELTENKKIYAEYNLVYYTPLEELLNAITHGLGIPFGIIGLIFMLLRAESPVGILASCLFAAGFIALYSISTTYHVLRDLKAKRIARRIDHASVNLVVISCGVTFCLMCGNNPFNYIALALCYVVTICNFLMCWFNLEKFKKLTFLSNFVTGLLLFAVFLLNRDYVPTSSKYIYLTGLILVLCGTSVFGVKKPYLHTVFHIFTFLGTAFMYVASYYMIF